MRSHLASAPDHKPEPPLYPTKTPIFAVVVRLIGVMVLAAAGALGFLWITAPQGAPPQLASKPGGNDVALASYPPVSYRGLEAPQNAARAPADVAAARTPEAPPSATRAAAIRPRDAADGIGAPSAALAPRVAVAPRSPSRVTAPLAAAEPAPAPPPAASAFAAAVPPPAARPAAPAPVPAAQAFAAAAPPPAAPAPLPAAPALAAVPPPAAPAPVAKAPAPVIAAPVWATPPGTPQTRDPDEIAGLLLRARTYLADGDVAAARLVLRRAAERDDSQAALALGGTYDPIVLKRLGIINFYADPAQARDWYRKAAELGSPDAASRLEQLAQTDR